VVGYWLLTALLVLSIVCLGVVASQRDTARSDLETYRQRLVAVDPHEARVLAEVLARRPRRGEVPPTRG
jgi:hypothetical protein